MQNEMSFASISNPAMEVQKFESPRKFRNAFTADANVRLSVFFARTTEK